MWRICGSVADFATHTGIRLMLNARDPPKWSAEEFSMTTTRHTTWLFRYGARVSKREYGRFNTGLDCLSVITVVLNLGSDWKS